MVRNKQKHPVSVAGNIFGKIIKWVIAGFPRRLGIVILLTLACIPAISSLLQPGFYEPHDLHHFADIYEMYRAIGSGQIIPRLGPDFIFGYGYPLFNFYYVLPFYLGALFIFIFSSIVTSFKLVFVVGILISVYGMYVFLRQFAPTISSITGAVLYLYTPYRFVQVYVRGAIGEVWIMALLPWVLWSLFNLVKNSKKWTSVGLMAVVTALFILSHNYLWVLSAIFMLPIILYLVINNSDSFWLFKRILLAGLLALGLSAFWWLPALIEQRLVASTTPFPLIDHFPFVSQLIFPSWGYGSSVWGPSDQISFQIGLTNLLVLLAVIVLVVLKIRSQKPIVHLKLISYLLGAFAILVFLMNIRSYEIWTLLPFYNFIQFPWRLLFLITLITAWLAPLLIRNIPVRFRSIMCGLIMASAVITTFNYAQPSRLFNKTDETYLSRFFANRTMDGEKQFVSSEYYQYSEDYLLLPEWTETRPRELPAEKITTEDGKITDIKRLSDIYWQAKVTSEHQTEVTLRNLYFPGWIAYVDGERTEIHPGKPYGQIEVVIPAGIHQIEFKWKETPLRLITDIISLITLVTLVFLVIHQNLKDLRNSNNSKRTQ